jgi:hypothetical protein
LLAFYWFPDRLTLTDMPPSLVRTFPRACAWHQPSPFSRPHARPCDHASQPRGQWDVHLHDRVSHLHISPQHHYQTNAQTHQPIPRQRELGKRRTARLVGERPRRLVHQPPNDQRARKGKANNESTVFRAPSITRNCILTPFPANERERHTRPLRGDVLEVQGGAGVVHLKKMLRKLGCTVYTISVAMPHRSREQRVPHVLSLRLGHSDVLIPSASVHSNACYVSERAEIRLQHLLGSGCNVTLIPSASVYSKLLLFH